MDEKPGLKKFVAMGPGGMSQVCGEGDSGCHKLQKKLNST